MGKIRTSTLKRNSGRYLVLWGNADKVVPQAPDSRENLTEESASYWHDLEYAGWDVEKTNIPESPRNGARGKRVVYIQPGTHPYLEDYRENLQSKADSAGIELIVLQSDWDDELFHRNVDKAITLNPDLILLNPENQKRSTEWYKKINKAGIPVFGGNFLPQKEGFAYLAAWTGPDDWGQSRLLARALADAMNNRGNYAILRHLEGTSSFYARTYGIKTELNRQAPEMKCLDMKAPGIGRQEVYEQVLHWLDTYGTDLQALVCADDELAMLGVVDALKERKREDIVTVAAGSSRTGLELLRHGWLEAISFQNAAVDGSIAMETIIDWFEGIPVEPIRYLPKYIIHKEEAEEFLKAAQSVESFSLDRLYQSVDHLDWEGCYAFFGDAYELFLNRMVIPTEMLRGFALEALTGLIVLLQKNFLLVDETIGSYENLVKHLVREESIAAMLEWLNAICQKIIRQLSISRYEKTPIQKVLEYVEEHYKEPLSLKTLAWEFGLSQVYLGQLFKGETGEKFSDYLNGKRVEKARLLLTGENVKASDVAVQLGYSDPAYFYKIFKKYTGHSVSEFIKNYRTNL